MIFILLCESTTLRASQNYPSLLKMNATPVAANPLSSVEIGKPFKRTPYLIIAAIFVVIIIGWLVLFIFMYSGNSGSFGNYTRPPPTGSGLVPVNGELKTLTAEEKAALKTKVQQALANIAARQNGA